MQTLNITFNNGATEHIGVECGSAKNARRLPARIGWALIRGEARAILAYDNKPRKAVEVAGRFYMRMA